MSKRIAILQSNYIPWKGYFDLINMVDEFIFYDNVQYTKNDWRNRNIIKTHDGLKWLTIPVERVTLNQKICETRVQGNLWRKKHWNMIRMSYAKAPFLKNYYDVFEDLYLNKTDDYLCQINYEFIRFINYILNINTKLSFSVDYSLCEGTTERLIDLCKQTGAKEYISGPAAKNYLNEELFKQENIKLRYIDYSNYPVYNQLFPPFENNVSIIDLILNEGHNAYRYLKSFNEL